MLDKFVGISQSALDCKLLLISNSVPIDGQVAQSVEQWTENPRVGSSILPLATTTPHTQEFAGYIRPTCPREFKTFPHQVKSGNS